MNFSIDKSTILGEGGYGLVTRVSMIHSFLICSSIDLYISEKLLLFFNKLHHCFSFLFGNILVFRGHGTAHRLRSSQW